MANRKNNSPAPFEGALTTVSPVEKALAQNNITEAVELIGSDTEYFSAFIKSTETALSENKSRAEIIKDRKFFKRLFSSSSSELAQLLLEQNDVMVRFFVMLQLLTLQNKNNISVLTKLCSAIQTDVDTSGKEQGNLQKIAITFLEQNIESIKAEETRDKALIKLLKFAEQNAAFEKRMISAEENAEKRYQESLQKLNNDYAAFKNTIDGKINTIKNELEKKASIEELNSNFKQIRDSLSETASKTDVVDLHNDLTAENHILKKRMRLSIIIGSIALIISISITLFSVLGFM